MYSTSPIVLKPPYKFCKKQSVNKKKDTTLSYLFLNVINDFFLGIEEFQLEFLS